MVFFWKTNDEVGKRTCEPQLLLCLGTVLHASQSTLASWAESSLMRQNNTKQGKVSRIQLSPLTWQEVEAQAMGLRLLKFTGMDAHTHTLTHRAGV